MIILEILHMMQQIDREIGSCVRWTFYEHEAKTIVVLDSGACTGGAGMEYVGWDGGIGGTDSAVDSGIHRVSIT